MKLRVVSEPENFIPNHFGAEPFARAFFFFAERGHIIDTMMYGTATIPVTLERG